MCRVEAAAAAVVERLQGGGGGGRRWGRQVVVEADGNSLTGNFQKTKIPNTINIRDITHATTGLLILISVINIIYLLV